MQRSSETRTTSTVTSVDIPAVRPAGVEIDCAGGVAGVGIKYQHVVGQISDADAVGGCATRSTPTQCYGAAASTGPGLLVEPGLVLPGMGGILIVATENGVERAELPADVCTTIWYEPAPRLTLTTLRRVELLTVTPADGWRKHEELPLTQKKT